MKKTFTTCLLSLFFITLISSTGFTESAKDILDKMIEANGGRKALEKIEDSTLSGSIEMTQMGMSGTMTMYNKEPNMMRWDIEIMGMVITQAYDGETAWWINPQTGSVEDLPEQQAEDFKRQSLGNDALLHPEKYGITYTLKEKETIEGKDYFVLEQTYTDGFKAMMWVDPETYLPHKTKAKSYNQMGAEVESEVFLSDYKKVEGMPVPHSIIIFQDGEEFLSLSVTEVKYNSNLEDSFFKKSE